MPIGPAGQRVWLLAALFVAVVVRVALLADKPFWRDEVWVARCIESPFTALREQPRPLPPGFLLLVQHAAALPLAPEVSYRLVPLVAGLALVPLLGRLAVALGAAPPVPLIAVWLAAGAPALVYYSRELKSYELDALLAVIAPLLALRLFGRGAGTGLRPAAAGAALAAALAAAPWLTFGATFAIAALLVWGWLRWWPAAEPGARRWWLAASVLFTVSFALVFMLFLDQQSANPTLQAVWREAGLRAISPSWPARAAAGAGRFVRLTLRYALMVTWPVGLALGLLGIAAWPQRGRALLCWLYAGAGLAALAAALAGRFLIAEERLLLFALPPVLLAAAAALAAVGRWIAGARGAPLALAAAAAFSLVWSAGAIAHRVAPGAGRHFIFDVIHDVEAMLDAAGAIVPAGEPVYIAQFASRSFLYYADERFADATVCLERCALTPVTSAWLAQHDRRGWMILTDDDVEWYTAFLTHTANRHEERLRLRGMRLWRISPG